MGERETVRRGRVLAAVLLVVGVVALAAPGGVRGADCGPPVAPKAPTSAQAWSDIDALQGNIAVCPGVHRIRRVGGGAALLGALLALAVPAFAARRGPQPAPLTPGQRLVVLRAAAAALAVLSAGALTTSVHDGLSLCGTPIAAEEIRDDGCDTWLLVRRVLGAGAAVGAVGAGGLATALAREDEG